jgi:ketosteroid isomerase-like protein
MNPPNEPAPATRAVGHRARRAAFPSAALLGVMTLSALPACGKLPPAPGSPERDGAVIRDARLAQNEAIEARDWDRVAAYWTEDVTIRAGLGATLSGRDAYREAFARDASVVYERTTTAVEVSRRWPLAWESGTWVGRDRRTGELLASGNYAAQWRRGADGRWRIRGELFVSLGCENAGCDWSVFP